MTLIHANARCGIMQIGVCIKFHKVGLELDMPGGACVLFDPTRMEHGMEVREGLHSRQGHTDGHGTAL